MLANIPAVLIGDKLAGRLPLKAIRLTVVAVFLALGVVILSGLGR
jgi:putative Ca2+/H+ antiporter (TMEM165/GDT1 family)